MAAKKKSKKTEKPPPIDRLLKPAIGVVLAFVAYYFMKGLDADVPRIDVNDELALREVFFGEGHGQSYVVLCNTLPAEDSTSKPLPISSVFQDAMDEFSSTGSGETGNKVANFVLMDCTHTLPTSGKTIAQKFKLDLKKRPTIFISSPKLDGSGPKQIPAKHLKTGHMLAKVIRQMLLPHTHKIESSKDLKAKCLNSSHCAVLLKGGTPQKFVKDAVANLLEKYSDSDNVKKQISFASVDSSSLYLTGLEEHLPEFTKGEHRFVVFKKVSGGLGEKDSRLITSMVSLSEDDKLSHNSMENLITATMSGKNKDKVKKLSSIPQVKTRTKKLEEQERAKRQRKSNASQKKSQPQQAASHSGENDGSKEGRKAERDRRRDEHRKQNPNYRERTPEEIAEIERKRRQRMQEESEKWNIGAEDAPPEGDPVDEGSEYGDFEEGGEEYDLDENEEEDDEDVMDLD